MIKKKEDFDIKELGPMLDKIQEMQYQIFVKEEYINKDIESFKNALENLEEEINIINGRTPTERENKIIHLWGELQILKELFHTKKFMESKTDITIVASIFMKMAKDCLEIGE